MLIEYYNTHRNEVSLTQIGRMFGISRQRVHYILKRAEKYKGGEKNGTETSVRLEKSRGDVLVR